MPSGNWVLATMRSIWSGQPPRSSPERHINIYYPAELVMVHFGWSVNVTDAADRIEPCRPPESFCREAEWPAGPEIFLSAPSGYCTVSM